MNTNRRRFLAAGAACSAAAAFPCGAKAVAGPPKPQAQAALKLSSQLGIIPGRELAEKLALMEQWGFHAVELPGDVAKSEKKYTEALRNTNLKVSAVCWGSHGGDLVSEVVEKRAVGIEALRQTLTAAGALGSTGVIFVPAFNGQTKLTNQEIRAVLLDILPELGEHAVKCGTRILLEPLNRNEAFFLRLVADAAAIARDCKTPGVAVMGDFYHMYIEEPSDLGAFISAGQLLHHVHLASRERVLPGQDDRRFVEGFRGLQWIGYQDYCSFECRVRGDPHVEIPKSMAFLRREWEEASA